MEGWESAPSAMFARLRARSSVVGARASVRSLSCRSSGRSPPPPDRPPGACVRERCRAAMSRRRRWRRWRRFGAARAALLLDTANRPRRPGPPSSVFADALQRCGRVVRSASVPACQPRRSSGRGGPTACGDFRVARLRHVSPPASYGMSIGGPSAHAEARAVRISAPTLALRARS